MLHFLFRLFGALRRGRGAVAACALAMALNIGTAARAGEAPFDPEAALAELAPLAIAAGEADLSDTARLKAGILCVAWARDMIAQHWRVLDALDGPGTWSRARQQLWMQAGWVEEFEAQQVRPVIDAASQTDLLALWWPDGVRTEAGSAAAMRMHRFCTGLPGLLGTITPDAPPGF
ncbi:hypothetical protein [Rhodovulum strictum]|uniref:Uncharacterized protein n=1 Tax=Rhodovulum strictum TaxID=58314 RepID=A0A844B486_9RHOB|nr:hypothetical protein [Rhodovulum strictum]MRH21186.1 hypothetical protein [Rhodovulum strictum]